MHVVKLAGVRTRVIKAFSRSNVHVFATAIEGNMPFGSHITGRRIIRRVIAVKIVIGGMDCDIPAQRISIACLLAFVRINGDRVLFTDGKILLLRVCLRIFI